MKSLLWRVWAPFDFVCVVFVFRVCFWSSRLRFVWLVFVCFLLLGFSWVAAAPFWFVCVFCFWGLSWVAAAPFCSVFVCLFVCIWACLGSPWLRLALFLFVFCFGACLGLPRLRFALFVVFLFPFFGPCGPCLPLGPYDPLFSFLCFCVCFCGLVLGCRGSALFCLCFLREFI